MRRKRQLRTLATGFLLGSLVRFAQAEIPHITDPQESEMPSRVLALDSIAELPKPLWPRPWRVYAAPGVRVDRNVNHLLINSTVDSNVRSPDTIFHTEAGISYRPDYWKKSKPFLSYVFERFDYQDHDGFSYYKHQLYGGYDYWFARRFALDTGIESTWYADETGLVTNDQNLHAGLRWRHKRYRARAGYAFRRAGFIYSPGKDALANSGYVELARSFFKRQSVYAYGDFRWHHADDPVFSYRSNYAEAGWINAWTSRWRVIWIGSYLDKDYAAFDARFGEKRQDQTVSFTARPSFAFYPNLRLTGSYTYSENRSNVETKKYADQLYELSLEARF